MSFQWHKMKFSRPVKFIHLIYSKIETTTVPATVATTVPTPTGTPGPPPPPGNRNISKFFVKYNSVNYISHYRCTKENLL